MTRPPTLLVVPDGMAGWKQPALDGLTPLQAARTPNLDQLTSLGRIYRLQNIPDECPADSGIANMALLGYDPRKYYLGRGALEALNLGVDLKKGEVAFRCNLVTVGDGQLVDYSAENLPTEVACDLFASLQDNLGNENLRFVSGLRYRGLMICDQFKEVECFAPHDEMGRKLVDIWPQGPGCEALKKLMLASREILNEHPVNIRRKKTGKKPANMIWPWGGGEMRSVPPLKKQYQMEGHVVAGVDLINGLGRALGMKIENVPGATGDFDTDMEAKSRRACEVLAENKMVFLHVEAPDEAGHEGDPLLKKEMIERWDREVAGLLLKLYRKEKFRLALGPDHYTPVQKRTHVRSPVPFLILDGAGCDDLGFSEAEAQKAPLIPEGWQALASWYKQSPRSPF